MWHAGPFSYITHGLLQPTQRKGPSMTSPEGRIQRQLLCLRPEISLHCEPNFGRQESIPVLSALSSDDQHFVLDVTDSKVMDFVGPKTRVENQVDQGPVSKHLPTLSGTGIEKARDFVHVQIRLYDLVLFRRLYLREGVVLCELFPEQPIPECPWISELVVEGVGRVDPASGDDPPANVGRSHALRRTTWLCGSEEFDELADAEAVVGDGLGAAAPCLQCLQP